ncbi:ATP-binding protein [Caulobacter sp. NIBR2454]|uniref:ATP-binding protein n=1 Tax=Caulobacter sp. NIBR2454 TaxID=3015996 RepID=UPI0022B74274|nr:ATP-binding protein [Caulobacter sp. NIBR2454]
MCAVLVEFLGSFILYEHEGLQASRDQQAREMAHVLIGAVRILDGTAPAARAGVAAALKTDTISVRWKPSAEPVRLVDREKLRGMGATMARQEPGLLVRGFAIEVKKPRDLLKRKRVTASASLEDGSRVVVGTDLRWHVWDLLLQQLVSAAILCVGVITAAVMLLRSMGGPLGALAQAAEAVGADRTVHVPEVGAGDLRRVARAFNAMQKRISELLTARTHALAAAGHDLRTPLARLRLRAGMVADPETREALERDVDEMTAMLNSLLDYLGGGHEAEPARLTDVAAICLTLVDEACDAGGQVRYTGPDHLMVKVRPVALKRAIDNLIQNAVTYAGDAHLILSHDPQLTLAVEDSGPGIPEDQLSHVVDAFHRLDHARARNTSGMGLGLSIVQRIADGENGALNLINRPQGGLRAELVLPHAH